MNNKTFNENTLGLPIGTTLDRYIRSKQDEISVTTGDFSRLLRDIALAGKIVNHEINRSGLVDVIGKMGNKNVQGEEQQKLDVIAHIRFVRALRNGGVTAAVLSEEKEKIIQLNKNSRYVVCIDPLDGSSNINVNVSIGTIFSIYKRISHVGEEANKEDFLQMGKKQIGAGYILYGSSTMLVYTTGKGVHGFTLEPSLGEFLLSHNLMISPKIGKIYSINDGLWEDMNEKIKVIIAQYRKKRYTGRYIGSLVADFHRNLIKGGIYIYPNTLKAPKGKIRVLYEANAMAMLAEQAGGAATDGKKRILEIKPESIHERTPIFVGNKKLVDDFKK